MSSIKSIRLINYDEKGAVSSCGQLGSQVVQDNIFPSHVWKGVNPASNASSCKKRSIETRPQEEDKVDRFVSKRLKPNVEEADAHDEAMTPLDKALKVIDDFYQGNTAEAEECQQVEDELKGLVNANPRGFEARFALGEVCKMHAALLEGSPQKSKIEESEQYLKQSFVLDPKDEVKKNALKDLLEIKSILESES